MAATGKPEKEIVIHIDKKQYKVSESELTGSAIRQLPDPDISQEYELELEVPGGDDRPIADGEVVQLKNGMHFFSAPRNITAG